MGASLYHATVKVPRLRYPFFLAAALISFAGDWLTTVAVGVLLFQITGSVAAPALFVLVRTAPRIVGPLAGGALADRFPPLRAHALVPILRGTG